MDDLQLLAQHFVEQLNRGSEKQVGGFEDAVWSQLGEYNWPCNLDEKKNWLSSTESVETNDNSAV